MERISRITISLMVSFVVVGLISNEVQGDAKCMSSCNSKCLKSNKANSVHCGVACFVECLDWGNKNGQVSPEMKAKLADLKKKAMDGSISKKDVDGELKEIAKKMMTISESKMHEHDHKNGEKLVNAPPNLQRHKEGKDITDDDDDDDDDETGDS